MYSAQGVRVVRSVAAIPGWTATWQPRQGPAQALAVQRDGLVQAVDVPPGLGVVTWRYTPPGFSAGLVLSLAATVLVLLFFLAANWVRRPVARPGLRSPASARRADPGANRPRPAHRLVTPTAALSASIADPCRAMSARSNGPVQASPNWFRWFLLFRHRLLALARMKSRYSARGLQQSTSSYRFRTKMPLNCAWSWSRPPPRLLARLGQDARRYRQVAQRGRRDGLRLREVGAIAGDVVQDGEPADDPPWL